MKEDFPKEVAVALTKAEAWTKNYRDEATDHLVSGKDKKKVNSFVIPRETLELVLQLNTEAVRVYLGVNDDKEKTLIFVGAEKDENGVYRDKFGTSSERSKEGSSESVVYDFAQPSPPYTPDNTSPLN